MPHLRAHTAAGEIGRDLYGGIFTVAIPDNLTSLVIAIGVRPGSG
jgi:hypothetical protein